MSKKRLFYFILPSFIILLWVFIGFYFSSVILYPKRHSLEQERMKLGLPNLWELGFSEAGKEEISFETDGILHRGWFFRGMRSCGLVAHHGITSNRVGTLPYVRHFNRCHILIFDARGHGESEKACVTYGYYEKNALKKAAEILQEKTGLKKDQIGLIGESLGATTVLLFASENSGYAFFIADSPYVSVERIIRERARALYGSSVEILFFGIAKFFSQIRGHFLFNDVNLEKWGIQITDPVLLVHAKNDSHTVLSHSEAIFQKLPEGKKELFITDWTKEHARSIHRDPEKYMAKVKAFISRYAPTYPALW